MPDAHRKPLRLASATYMELTAVGTEYQAAVLRGDAKAQAEIRAKAHALLDAYLDLMGEAAEIIARSEF